MVELSLVKLFIKNCRKDKLMVSTLIFLFAFSSVCFFYRFKFGIVVVTSFIGGIFFGAIFIEKRNNVEKLGFKVKTWYQKPNVKNKVEVSTVCDICTAKDCKRHFKPMFDQMEDAIQNIEIDIKLNEAAESFLERIISNFIQSWFMFVSTNSNFLAILKQGLKGACLNLILNFYKVDGTVFITQKFLPIILKHAESVNQILKTETSTENLPKQFLLKEKVIHPAACSRKSEKDYLRALSKCLIPKIFHNESFESKIFFSLIREIFACWIFLPLMDVLSDPNILNLLIITLMEKNHIKKLHIEKPGKKVEFLQNFCENNEIDIVKESSILKNGNKLYAFMQFLKKNDLVEILRFFLDVENLNLELADAKTTSDPVKLSSLYQESEKLMDDYSKFISTERKQNVTEAKSLTEAHENIKNLLEGELRESFSRTPEYFTLIYGVRKTSISETTRNNDANWGVAKLRSKIKGAFKGNIGTSFEATEIPTVWDALAEPELSASSNFGVEASSKPKRDRGQNLNSFLLIFFKSLEIRTEIAEDMNVNLFKKKKKTNFTTSNDSVFGNLFELNRTFKLYDQHYISFKPIGPAKSFLHIAITLLKVNKVFSKLLFSFVKFSEETMNSILNFAIRKLVCSLLYQPRLGALINILEHKIFENERTENTVEEQKELKERRELACSKLQGLDRLLDILQSPALNKHLMYCTLDALISEFYPEFQH